MRQHRGAHLIGLTAPRAGPARRGRRSAPPQRHSRPGGQAGGAGRRPEYAFCPRRGHRHGSGPLTDQQLRVLALLSLGLTASTVAARLGLSERGVAKSKMAIFTKLGAQSQAQAVATALANGLLGPSTVLPQTSTDVPIERLVREKSRLPQPGSTGQLYRSDLPKVVTVHDNRFVAAGLLEALAGRAEVVADSAYGAAALRLADLITPDVVVAGELLGDGLIDHFLTDLVRVGARVLLLVDELHADRVLELGGAGPVRGVYHRPRPGRCG